MKQEIFNVIEMVNKIMDYVRFCEETHRKIDLDVISSYGLSAKDSLNIIGRHHDIFNTETEF